MHTHKTDSDNLDTRTEFDPILSIVIPVYNTEKYLRQCIDSILNQDFKDYELILVDDGSTDTSIDIIKHYIATDKRVSGYYIRGKGPAEPRNYGTDRAHGKYILYIDSDDYLPEGALSKLVTTAKSFPDADFIKGSHKVLTNGIEHNTKYAERRKSYAGKYLSPAEALMGIIHGHNIPCNILYRAEFFKNHFIHFEEQMSYLEDGPFLMEFFSNKPISVYLDEETYVYRLGAEGSVTNTKLTAAKVKSLIVGGGIYKSLLKKFCDSPACFSECQKQMYSYAIGSLMGAIKLENNERKDCLKMLMAEFPQLPNIGSIKNQILLSVYNTISAFHNLYLRLCK